MDLHLSDELTAIFTYSREEALRTACTEVQTGHFLLGILRHADNVPFRTLKALGADTAKIKNTLDSTLKGRNPIRYDEDMELHLSREAENCFNLTVFEATSHKQSEISSAHLLLAISKSNCPLCTSILSGFGITHDILISKFSEEGQLNPESESVDPEEIIRIFACDKKKQIIS